MENGIQIGYFLGLSLIGIGVGTSFASCPDKIDPQLCNKLNQVNDTDWVGCMVGLKLQPPDSQATDPTKDMTMHHSTTPPAPYLVAEVDSLFTNFELRWPDTISQYRLAQYPTKTRASVPTMVVGDYGVFVRKQDILSIGNKDYIGGVWAWLPDGPAPVTPFLRKDLESRYQGTFFNLNGRRMDGQKFQAGPDLKVK